MFILEEKGDGEFELSPKTLDDITTLNVDAPGVRKERARVWVLGEPKVVSVFRTPWGYTYVRPDDVVGGDYAGSGAEGE